MATDLATTSVIVDPGRSNSLIDEIRDWIGSHDATSDTVNWLRTYTLEITEVPCVISTASYEQSMRQALRTAVRKNQGLLSHLAPGRSLVDELIRERREEAAREK